MAIYWDQCQVNISNTTNSPMTYSSQNVTTGFMKGDPTSNIAPKNNGSFLGSSTSGLLSGCGGSVVYSLTDGTLVTINYWVAYPYGPADNSTYSVGFQGARANLYTYKGSTNNESSNGGAGKRVTWTVEIGMAT